MSTELKIREALAFLKPQVLKPWLKLDGLPYLHATDDTKASPWGTPVVGRFDYMETADYIAACNPIAMAELLAELDRLRATPAPGAPAQEVSFPPRILALLHEVADRVGTEFRGPFEDGNGDPLQDDADAAIAWIARQEAAAVQALQAVGAQDVAIGGLLCRLVDQLGERDRGNGNAPGHAHDVPGVWDSDNGAKAGTDCAWCALWAEAKKVRAALHPGAGEKTS